MLVGAFAHSSRFRVWFSDSADQTHLVVGFDENLRRLGGTARRWRVDRMAPVIVPATDRIQSSLWPVAKHYGFGVDPCLPRHGNRRGVVVRAIHYLTQRWWRTAGVSSPVEAQASADQFCVETAHRADRSVGHCVRRTHRLLLAIALICRWGAGRVIAERLGVRLGMGPNPECVTHVAHARSRQLFADQQGRGVCTSWSMPSSQWVTAWSRPIVRRGHAPLYEFWPAIVPSHVR